MRVIEKSAVNGFKCTLNDSEWVLFPVLAKMELDTKDRYKFFGCARERACMIGSGPRKGHSALRPCTPHSSRDDHEHLLKIVSGEIPAAEDRVSEVAASLMRRGVHPELRCTALLNCRHCLMEWPDRICHGLFNYDVMHCLYINCIGYLQLALLDTLTTSKQRMLDDRIQNFWSFKQPHTGVTSTKVSTLTRIGYISAERRVLHLFIWSHAIGSKAEIFPAPVRSHVLSAICSMQVMCYSVRGKRPFTETEHKFIFEHHGKLFFRSLAQIASWKRRKRIVATESYNEGKPPAKRRKVPYMPRVVKDSDESSDTASSSDDPDGSSALYERSLRAIIPHSLLHLPMQVVMGGTHQFHNTSANEASHKTCLQVAAERAQTVSDENMSAQSMLQYQMQRLATNNIIEFACGVCG